MLQIIYGRAATGKTYTVFEKIKNDVENGRQVVLLVPEQFTFESERTLLHTLDGQSTTNVSVLSFTRLYDEVSRFVGGRVADLINDSHKAILMGQAFAAVGDKLCLWGKYTDSPKFVKTLMSAVNEMKAAAVTPEELKEISNTIDEAYLKNKLQDLSLVYSAYEALLGNSFLDPEDNETRLYENLLKYKFFENKTVYVDAFRSFTGGQYKIIDRILSQADNVTFCFTACDIKSKKIDLFTNVRNTINRVIELAKKNRVEIMPEIELTEFHYSSEALKAVEHLFSGKGSNKKELSDENVTLCKCETPADEAEFAARTIRRLVREEGYRYKDFVIICRNADDYKSLVEQACKRNNVFCFADRRKEIKNLPLTVFINSLLSLVNRFDTDAVLSLLKTGLGPLTDSEISDLENYIYIWNINGAVWDTTWSMNPLGLTNKEFDDEKLKHLNVLHEKTVCLVKKFRKAFCGTPQEMVKAIIGIIEEYKIPEKLKANMAEYTEIDAVTGDDVRGGFDAVMEILDGIVRCLPNKEITIKQFIDSWEMAVSFTTIGNIPQMLDEVTFGSADRIKPSRPKIAFILGANMDVFPRNNSTGGIFAGRERDKLSRAGLKLISTDITVAVDEDFLVYSSICCAKNKLYVSYSSTSFSGSALEPSTIVSSINNAFLDIETVYEPQTALSFGNLPETEAAAVSKMCEVYNISKKEYYTIENALKNKHISVEDYLAAADKSRFAISPESAEKLYGNNIPVSATKVDVYHRCKFRFFCNYGIKAKKIEAADFNVLQRGTIVHFVLENAINEHGKKLGDFSKAECDAVADKYVKAYFDSVEGFNDIVTARMKFIIGKISLIVKDVLYHISREFAQTDFNPQYCEMGIGKDETVPEKVVKFGDDGKIRISGSIDRVDTWNGYLRVVDYKTGTKNFRLSDILVGLNLQMLIYLYCVVRGNNAELSSLKPAGVLYMPSKRERDDTPLTMNGLVLNDENVYLAMEQKNEGEFIPKHELDKSDNVKGSTYIGNEAFNVIFDHIEYVLKNMGEGILSGESFALPVDVSGSKSCKYCDCYPICCLEDGEHITASKFKNSEVIEKIKEEL